MEYARCRVRLDGDVQHEVKKEKITPAELVILRAIHGNDSVFAIEVYGQDRRPHVAELERLASIYTARDGDGGEGKLINKLFPPHMAHMLPVKFSDIGLDYESGELKDLDEPIKVRPIRVKRDPNAKADPKAEALAVGRDPETGELVDEDDDAASKLAAANTKD